MRRKDNRLGPLEAVFLVSGRGANGIDGPWRYVLGLFRTVIIAGNFSAVGTGKRNLRIGRVRRDITALASAHGIPTGAVNSARSCAGNGHGGVVLLRPVKVIREALVGSYVVELRRGLAGLAGPAGPAVGAHVGSAVI